MLVNSLDGRVKPLYNGNISETFWKTSSDDTERSYGYQYEALNRLNAALYQKSGQATMSYDEWMDYDKNGNIQHLSRNGAMDSQNQPQEIDVLQYTYHPQKKNQLMAVSDITGSPEGFKDGDGSQPLADDYVYDENGNMVSDANKGITLITYNHLNLPVKILFDSDLNKIEYLYTASGEKVEKTVTKNGTPVITTYLGGFQYKGKILLFFPTAEGYVNYTAPTLSEDVFGSATPESFNYVYNYTDHLGNIRLSYSLNPSSEELTVIEENHYYPFGLKHSKYNSDWNMFSREESGIKLRPGRPLAPSNYKYKFQGQERQDELGLNWDSFKWRNYDFAIGRFMSIDPLAEKYAYNGTYNFSENRVIDGRELEGLEVVLINPTKSSSNEQQKAGDKRIVKGAKNIPNSSTIITVTGHGSPKGMSNDVRGGQITDGKGLDAVLNRNSDAWKNKESGEGMTVVLYSCRTGADVKDENGKSTAPSFAQTISGSEEFKDVEIIAPDQRVYFTEDGPIGTYEAEYAGPNDEYKPDAKDHSRSETPGNWNVFKNGELIRSYHGDWQPTNNPGFFESLFKQN